MVGCKLAQAVCICLAKRNARQGYAVVMGQRCPDIIIMCAHGNTVIVRVIVPAHLSYTKHERVELKAVDSCLAPIVQALNRFGLFTANCCCGHGTRDGSIILHDGRVIVIPQNA